MLGKIGDRVEVIGIGRGYIYNIRLDDNNDEIYTINLDNVDGLFVARHCELRWL
jgi:hypothetical protein